MALIVGDVINKALRMANRVDPQHRVRALDAVDRAVRYFSERLPWPSLERVEEFRANGSQYFTFPARVRVIRALGDKERCDYIKPGDQWERQYPTFVLGDQRPAGAWEWQDRGWVPTIQNPATDTTLLFTTTQSEAVSVTVRGLVRDTTASGTALELVEADEVIAANITPVTSANTYVEIFGIEKDAIDGSADLIVAYNNGANSQAARIPSNERAPQYRRIEWLGNVSAGDRFRCRYYTRPAKINDEQQVLDAAVDEDIIMWATVGDLHWMSESPEAAAGAWQQRDALMQAKLTAQRSHGDNLQQAIPYAPMIDEDPWDYDFI